MAQFTPNEDNARSRSCLHRYSFLFGYVLVALCAFIIGIRWGEVRQPGGTDRPSITWYTLPNARQSSIEIHSVDSRNPTVRATGAAPESEQLTLVDNTHFDAELDEKASVSSVLDDFRSALEVLQTSYFELWLGTWPDAIDWTAAVMGTFVSASLSSLTRASNYISQSTGTAGGPRSHSANVDYENEMNKYFTQTIGYYFGEDAFAIRLQAYDDMLWVVLGWLESIKHIRQRTIHHSLQTVMDARGNEMPLSSDSWFGNQFVPIFAHRARIFYDLAKDGYDYSLCGGGMLWNPHLLPYKNAITNELFISASIGMYLYFPGDDNESPFSGAMDPCPKGPCPSRHSEPLVGRAGLGDQAIYDVEHLHAAVEGYRWLKNSNMVNSQGLYVDGFHIKNYGVNGTIGTGRCDIRNEMVYTYNQGVLLSGLRGLWEGTGQRSYLEDGHNLVRSVINATGWDVYKEPHLHPGWAGRWKWYGLGRAGILEEQCDSAGTCNQDGQTFKGIFFHHLTLFCEPLPRLATKPGKTFAADPETAFLHHSSCLEYREWVVRNAQAALNTRNNKGEFGMWWTWGLSKDSPEDLAGLDTELMEERTSSGGKDYKTDSDSDRSSIADPGTGSAQDPWFDVGAAHGSEPSDPNNRFRGRTVETQGGGLAVVRAMYEFIQLGDTS